MLAYAAAFTLPALTANLLVLADLAAFTLNSHAALSLVLTCRISGFRTLQAGSKKAGVGAGQGANFQAGGKPDCRHVVILVCN
jgi:hypothetical protein